jgi:AraC-like DNA-binding protein
MESLDTAIRLMAIGQIVLTGLVLAARRQGVVSLALVLLQISVVAFLVKSSPTLAGAVPFAQAPLMLLSMAAPYFVWFCANVLFEFERPPKWLMVLLPSTTFLMCSLEIVIDNSPLVLRSLSIIASLIAIVHANYSIVRGGVDDLCHYRRLFRLCFVGCISLVTAFILILELVYIGQPEPGWLPVTNASLIAIVSLLIHLPLMARPDDLLPRAPEPPGGKMNELGAADQQTHEALVRSMENRGYARTGLTIRQLAEELRTPEHQLRALINTRLGYKNFSTFLNGYRIEETCQRLMDPKEARVPILTIALDAGFASLAPFNRAFRQSMGKTPSEFRREKLQPAQIVTPIRR